jgi:hypothetical protein
MKYTLSFLFVFLFATISYAFTPPEQVELLSNEPFKADSINILNIDDMGDSVEVVMEVFTTGAIQKRLGKMMSGGRDARKLRGTYVYVINKNNEIINKDYKWLKAKRAPNKFNYLSIPLTDSDAHLNSKVFATEKDAVGEIDYLKFKAMKTEDLTEEEFYLKADSMMNESLENFGEEIAADVKAVANIFKKKEFTGDDLPETIYLAEPVISAFGGKLKKMRSTTFTKRPDGEKGFLTGRYERKDYEKYDLEMEDVFDNEDKRLTSSHHVINDPLTGNVIIYAGVRVRKDDDRENNEYYEHLILTLNHKGKIINQVTLKNEKAWSVGTMRLIGEEKFAQIADPKFEKIYISQYQPDKDFNKGADLSKRRMLLINKKGEVEYKTEFECMPGYKVQLQRVREIDDNVLANYYFAWPEGDFAGIYTFNPETGSVDSIMLNSGQAGLLIPTKEEKEVMSIMNYITEDSTRYLMDLYYHKEVKGTEENPGTPARYYNYFMYKLTPEGTLSEVVAFERQSDNFTDPMDIELLADRQDEFVFKIVERDMNRDFVRIKMIDKNQLKGREFSPPHPLLGDNAFYMDEESGRMYFVVQDDKHKVLLIQRQ